MSESSEGRVFSSEAEGGTEGGRKMSTEQATDWVPLCGADELAEGESRVREDGVAVFRHRGRLYAVEVM